MSQTENKNLELRAFNFEPVSLIDYLQVIAKRSRMIFFVTLAAAIVSVVYSLTLPNIYTAKTMILPTQEDRGFMSAMMAQLGGLAGLAGGFIEGSSTADLYVTMLKSEAVKDPIIDRFRLMEVYKSKYRTDTYKDLDKNVIMTLGKKDGVITITVDDKQPRRATEIATAYVDELGKLATGLNVINAGKNRSFLEERIARAKTDLAKAEEDLKVFQSKNKAVQVTAQAEASIKGVAELRAQLATQEVMLATYRRQFTESSQEVKTLVTSIANLKSQIAKLEGTGGNSSIPSVGSMPALGQEYVRLMREFKIQESLVELLTKQYEMAKFSEAKDVYPFQIIQKARIPERKSKPQRSKIIIIFTVAAFFCSVSVALLQENIKKMQDKDKAIWQEIRNQIFIWK